MGLQRIFVSWDLGSLRMGIRSWREIWSKARGLGKKEGALGIAKVTRDFPRDLRWEGVRAESFWSLPVRSSPEEVSFPEKVEHWMPRLGKDLADLYLEGRHCKEAVVRACLI